MNHGRRVLLPPNKRKERESYEGFLKPSNPAKPNNVVVAATARSGTVLPKATPPEPAAATNNQLLAGYLAHEFLAKGTLLGQPWDPARAEAVPVSMASSESKKRMRSSSSSSSSVSSLSQKAKADEPPAVAQSEKKQRNLEVGNLFKGDEAHLPGIVNPTQLAHFLHL